MSKIGIVFGIAWILLLGMAVRSGSAGLAYGLLGLIFVFGLWRLGRLCVNRASARRVSGIAPIALARAESPITT